MLPAQNRHMPIMIDKCLLTNFNDEVTQIPRTNDITCSNFV